MDIKTRVRNILVSPDSEWPVIEAETTPQKQLVTSYVLPLAAIGAIAGFIGGSLVGISMPFVGTYRVPIVSGLVNAIFVFAMAVAGVFILAFIINALAPKFGGEKNNLQAFKVAVYSYTPAWLAGVFQIIPALGILGLLLALYSLYLLYRGLPRLMKSPPDKAIPYTAVVIVSAIALWIVVAVVGGLIIAPAAMGSARAGEVQFDPNSPMGKLEALSRELEKSNQKMEEAGKSGDAGAEATAALGGLATLLGGGSRVEPVSADDLAAFAPDTLAGLPRKSRNAERGGIAGLQVATVKAEYSDDAGKSLTLEMTDTGGISGVMGLASWAGAEGTKEDEESTQRTSRIDGRLVHERVSKTGGTNEFSMVIADRFVVTAKGDGIDIGTLKGAVAAVDLRKLESLKKPS
ncbi:MAG: Yip1 family protein [Vicinamibacterales bacterium]